MKQRSTANPGTATASPSATSSAAAALPPSAPAASAVPMSRASSRTGSRNVSFREQRNSAPQGSTDGSVTARSPEERKRAPGATSPQEPKKPKLQIWPEFNDTEINNEKWDSTHGGKAAGGGKAAPEKGKPPVVTAPQYFDDPDGPLPLANSLRPERWRRPVEYFGEGKPIVVVDGENGGYFSFDLMSANEHIMHCELVRWAITQIDSLFKMQATKATGTEPAEVLVSPDGTVYNFRPWEHIFAINKVAKGPNIPAFNPYGKYVVRLFWLGQWRKIYVDDNLPLDENDKILLPMTSRQNELWPMLLTKALIKVAALDYGGGSGTQEFGDFSPIHCFTGWLPQTIMVRKESSAKLWEALQKLLPEWKLPQPEKETPDSLEEGKEATGATPDAEKQGDQHGKGGKAAADTKAAKGKEEKKETKTAKGEKAKEDTIVYDKPEVAIFASYYDATRRQPLQVTSLADGANKSEQLRQRGFSYLYSHPVQLTQFRVCPLEPPKPPEEVPAWKLIRPKVKRPLPLSEAPKLGDDELTEEGGPATAAERPIRAIEVASPFVNYKVDVVPLPQGTSRPTSSLSRRSTRPETPPNPKIDEFDESAPDWDVQEAARRKEEAHLAAERAVAAEERRLAVELGGGGVQGVPGAQAGEAAAAGDGKVQATDAKTTAKSGKGAAAAPASKLTSATGSKQQQQQQPDQAGLAGQSSSHLEALVESTVEMGTDGSKQVKGAERKKWLDLAEFIECFHCIHVYHKVHTYQHKQTHSDLKNIANSGTGKETRKSAAGVATPITNTDERSPMFLMVDSMEPSEIIFAMSALSRWPEPPLPVSAPTPTAGVGVSQPPDKPEKGQKSSSREFTKVSTEESAVRSETPTGAEEAVAHTTSGAAAANEPLVPGSFISEFHSWKTLRVGAAFKRLKTTGTKAISLNLPPGRHVLKIFMKAPLGYHCKMVSATPFSFGTEEDILPLLQKEPQRVKDYSVRLMQAVGNIIKTFHEPEQRRLAERDFWRLHCPFHGQRKFDGRKHWEVFKTAFYAMLIKALEGKNPTPDMASAWKTFMQDGLTKNPLQLTFSQKQKLEQDPNSWFNREIGPVHMIAVNRLQKCWRGTMTRKMLEARTPGGRNHDKVQELLTKAWSYIEPNAETLGLYLLRTLFRLSPDTAAKYPFSPDEANHLYFHDFGGSSPEQPAGQTFVAFREIFNVPETEVAGTRILAKMYSTVPTCCLRVINNDDYREFERSLGERMPSQLFRRNKRGYTMLGVARSPKDQVCPTGKWRLRLIGDDKSLLQPARNEVNANFVTRQLQDYYVPNQRRLIFRQAVRVAEDHLVTLHLRLSKLDVAVALEILDDEELMLSSEGKGQVFLPVFLFLKDKLPEGMDDGSGNEANRSPSRGSGRGGKKGSRGSARSKEGKLSHASSVSSIAHELTGEYKPHKYIIQARLLDAVWPLTASNWAFIEQLKEQEREDMKVVGKPKETADEAQKLEASSGTGGPTSKKDAGGSSAGGGAASAGKGKTAAPAKGGKDAKDAKGGDAKGGAGGKAGGADKKGGDKAGAAGAGDASASRPESAAFDERKAHWVLRVISDAVQSEEIEVKKDTERADQFKSMKRAWEEMAPGRAEKAKQSRLQYLSTHLVRNPEAPPSPPPPPEPVDPAAVEETSIVGAPPPPVTQQQQQDDQLPAVPGLQPLDEPLLSRPPTPPQPKEILKPLDVTAYKRGDPSRAVHKDYETIKQEEDEIMEEKLERFKEFLATWDERSALDKQARNEEKKNYLAFVQGLQKQTDAYREAYFRAREAYRQRCLESERLHQQELAAKQAEAEAAAAAEAEAAKGDKGGKKPAGKSPRASAKKGGKKK